MLPTATLTIPPKGANAVGEMWVLVRTGAPKNVKTLAAGPAAVCGQREGPQKCIHQTLAHGQARIMPAALWARGLVQRNATPFIHILFMEFGIPFRVLSHSGT